MIIFDQDENEFISNTYILPATIEKLKWKFDYSDAINTARKFMLKSDQRVSQKNVVLMFELVLIIKPKGKQKDDESEEDTLYQLTNGWGSISLNDLFLRGKVQKVYLCGGSPANIVEIDKKVIKPTEAKKKGFGLFGNTA